MIVFRCVAPRLLSSLRQLGIILLCLGYPAGYAQPTPPRQQADLQFYAQAYPRAIEGYTALLKDASLTTEARKEILFNLGYSYKEVGDYSKAVSAFAELLNMGPLTDKNHIAYLYFAQSLGQIGRIQEAQELFAQYEAHKSVAGPIPAGAMVDAGNAKITYRVESLGVNTSNAEFSPAYFRDGLVYVAGKGSSQSSAESGKGYLDLYYIPYRNELPIQGTLGSDGKLMEVARRAEGPRDPASRRLGRDAKTSPTANDSRTLGYHSEFVFSEGLGLGASSQNAARKVTGEAFSKELNTRYNEGPLAFSADGSLVIFTRNNYNEGKSQKSSDNVNKLKLYSALLQDGGWTNVTELPFNSNEFSTGHPALSRDGRSLIFASDRPGGQGGTDLYIARLEGGRWSAPVNLGAKINTRGDEMFPFIDETGNLYFASNGQAKGLGGLDIYFTVLVADKPGEIIHLDAPLNSTADDFGLITDRNRSTGYFSSNRLRGDDDIFRFVRESSLYGCRNLTLRIFEDGSQAGLDSVRVTVKARGEGRDEQQLYTNTDGLVTMCLEASNDFLFELSKDGYVSGMLGFSTVGLTDDKPTQLGSSLLRFDTGRPNSAPARMSGGESDWESGGVVSVSTLRGTVTGESNETPIEGVKIILKNECDGTIKQTVTGPNGRFQFELREGCDYTLVASKPLYGTNTNAIKKIPETSEPRLVSANLKMLKAGDLVTLDNIQYDSGKWDIQKEAARELDKMVATMRKYPSLKIEIGSHTDSQGSAQFNQYLSERRAKAALNYLASKGISRSRLTAKGYGESQLLNQCKDGVLCTEEEHQRNRRTEFKVLSIR
jgi:outer membrane protein OmpA-like peptidoglycan-associated protein/tetratricopeptide (TPR) repeat protein